MYEIAFVIAAAYGIGITILLLRCIALRSRPEVVVEHEIPIYDMPVNSVAWTVPWAFYMCGKGIYVNGKYTAHKRAGGTVKVKMVRTLSGVEIDGWPPLEMMQTNDSLWGWPMPVANVKSAPQIFTPEKACHELGGTRW